ncbi:MAG: hypothetical protein NWQ46_09895 [Spirosomaceae bacterium]|nr:hypothetical protein [Spirosomataceae bacterium]
MNKLWLGLSVLLYVVLAYFLERQQILLLLSVWGMLFVGYFFLIKEEANYLVFAGVVFRLIWLFATPALSDDFYRFAWDGRLLINDFNPFQYIPADLMQMPKIASQINAEELFQSLNSPNYYSVYPPLNQYLFGLASFISGNNLQLNVILLRVIILLAEGGTLWLLHKIKTEQKLKISIAVYALNPLVIIELTGNLHFEAVVIFFLILTYYLLTTKTALWKPALALASAVCVKMLPLIFLPLIVNKIGWKKGITFGFLVGLFCVLYSFPLLNLEIIQNISVSVNLYFKSFEFNASVYYVVREIGFWIYGYNIIGFAGRALSIIAFLLIMYVSFRKSSGSIVLPTAAAILTIYLLFATTVHPWYITPLVLVSCFTNLRYALAWSALIPLTYFSYTTIPYKENLWLVGLEYSVVFGLLIWEIYNKKRLLMRV